MIKEIYNWFENYTYSPQRGWVRPVELVFTANEQHLREVLKTNTGLLLFVEYGKVRRLNTIESEWDLSVSLLAPYDSTLTDEKKENATMEYLLAELQKLVGAMGCNDCKNGFRLDNGGVELTPVGPQFYGYIGWVGFLTVITNN